MVEEFRVGVISTTHGLHGEVKVYPTTDDPKRFRALKRVILDTGRERREVGIKSVKFFKNMVILGFEGTDRIEDAQKLRGAELYIPREEALPLADGEHYIPDLIGLKVIDEKEEELGVLKDVLATGANDVYIVDTKEGRDLLIPAIPECILDVNVEEGFMKVHLLDGLKDL
ncbi:MAG: 16S rRNA processing protein RimM [Lachnospiraceae bacterium]|nr:16S rRNA processing protein RimM [Lachnospiraceae bacterium]